MNLKYQPANLIANYVWQLLDQNTDIGKIGGVIPISAGKDDPAFSDSRLPYLIYGYSEATKTRIDQIHRGAISFRIMAPTFGRMGEIVNVITLAFEDCDAGAIALNTWTSANPDLVGIRFTKVEPTYVEGGQEIEREGAPFEGMINLSYEYITRQTVKTFKSNGTWA